MKYKVGNRVKVLTEKEILKYYNKNEYGEYNPKKRLSIFIFY